MLRPVPLLPPKGLSTVGFDGRDLSRRRDPATRRSDAYRRGTRTHWRGAASRRRPDVSVFVCVTTHHLREGNPASYSQHQDLQNSFQVILTDRSDVSPGDFDVEFRYTQCQWTTGDASGGIGGLGGTPANAGFDAGNGTDYLELAGSGTASVLDLCTTSNVGVPGLWRYSFRAGRPM